MLKSYPNININQRALVFKHWSRKSYAVFSSLGKLVHIGNLSAAVLQWVSQLVDVLQELEWPQLKCFGEEDSEDKLTLELVPVFVKNDDCYAAVHDNVMI